MSATAKHGRRSTCRLLKIECGDCGAILRGSAAALRASGLPTCGCGGAFMVPVLADLERIDPDAFDALIGSLSHKQHTAAMRELGYTDAIVRKAPPRRSRQPQCAHDGCSRFRAYGKRYCAQHEALEALPF